MRYSYFRFRAAMLIYRSRQLLAIARKVLIGTWLPEIPLFRPLERLRYLVALLRYSYFRF